MRKQLLSMVAVTFIIGIAIVTVISCSKTDQEKVKQQGVITHFSPSKDEVEPTITQFIQRFEDYKAGYKTGGEDIKLGEAVWTLEAGVNYTYQSPKEDLGDFTTDSLSTTVDVYIGESNEYYIAEADAMELYDEVLEFTGDNVNQQDTELLVADLAVVSVENGQAEMLVSTTTGKGLTNPYVINSTDYWYPTQDDGKCGDYVGNNIGKDASDRIRVILNASQVVADYWTDVTTSIPIYEVNCPCNYDQCFWEGPSDDCLSPTEMQEWLNKAACVVEELRPSGKSRIEAYFHWDVITYGVLYTHYFHYISYGIAHYSAGGKK